MEKLLGVILVAWGVAILVGGLLALAPLLLFLIGFALMAALLWLIARAVGSWF